MMCFGSNEYRLRTLAKTRPATLRWPHSLRLRRKVGLEELNAYSAPKLSTVQAPLSIADEERDVGRSLDRVSRRRHAIYAIPLQNFSPQHNAFAKVLSSQIINYF
jgi:hypothetical protein